jgi:cbb3-type cytochrome oxidase subunit 3
MLETILGLILITIVFMVMIIAALERAARREIEEAHSKE